MTIALEDLLLTPAAMSEVDRDASKSGLHSGDLMERAGQAVAATALGLFPGALRYVVLCGPGNNGGDGYVVARALRESGADVQVFHLGDPQALKGDAAQAFSRCDVPADAIESY